MAIKRIQLRGISRSPSDRMTEDGGCAESLNVSLDNTEIIPIVLPQDISESIGVSELESGRVFVHKMPSYENVIVLSDKKFTAISGKDKTTFILNTDLFASDISGIESIGNTVVVATKDNLYYFLYKGSRYSFLGNNVPFPTIKLEAQYEGEDFTLSQSDEYATSVGDNPEFFTEIPEESVWNELYLNKEHRDPDVKRFLEKFWNDIEFLSTNGKPNPVFVRYTVTLYDGRRLSSIPFIIGSESENPLTISLESTDTLYESGGSSTRIGTFKWTTNFNRKLFSIKATLLEQNIFKGWEDIVKSIDFFVSSAVPWNVQKNISKITNRQVDKNVVSGANQTETRTTSSAVLSFLPNEDYETELLSSSALTYLIDSVPIEEVTKYQSLINGKTLTKIDESEDLFVQRERLSGDDIKHYKQGARGLFSYNSMLILAQPTSTASYGCEQLNAYREYSVPLTDALESPMTVTYEVMFKINFNGQAKYVKGPTSTVVSEGVNIQEYAALQFFPDTRCEEMLIKATTFFDDAKSVSYGRLTMKPHPFLNCAYLYQGLTKDLKSLCNLTTSVLEAEDNLLEEYSKIYISDSENPLFYPVEGNKTFQSQVLGLAVATTPLSQGQFGQFPLYVFTEDGIWTMETSADGSFITNKPLSRDVCINASSITSLDNAVVFVSEKGLMLLHGSQVTNISPFMNGRHYTVEGSARKIVEHQHGFCDLLPSVTDNTSFMAFIKKAHISYDYAGNRIICLAPDEDYQYIYKIDTQTWHKTSFGIKLDHPINSYPECLIAGLGEGELFTYSITSDSNLSENEDLFRIFESILSELDKLPIMWYVPLNTIAPQIFDFLHGDIKSIEIKGDAAQAICRVIEEQSGGAMKPYISSSTAEKISTTKVYDFSTMHDVEDPDLQTAKGIIATRPFDLDEPDVLKTIKDVRIRGNFAKGAVKFILLGSMDGINFSVINTLHGKSWKLFRIILLTDLDPKERISWIDINYETRFANRLR